MTLVQAILQCNAEVRVPFMKATVRRGQIDLLHGLFSRFPPAHHSKCFKGEILMKICQYITNDLTTYIIERLLGYCESKNYMRCSADHQRLMERILCSTIIRENVKFIKILLPRTIIKQKGLIAAVRKANHNLINHLFVHEATVGGAATRLVE